MSMSSGTDRTCMSALRPFRLRRNGSLPGLRKLSGNRLGVERHTRPYLVRAVRLYGNMEKSSQKLIFGPPDGRMNLVDIGNSERGVVARAQRDGREIDSRRQRELAP